MSADRKSWLTWLSNVPLPTTLLLTALLFSFVILGGSGLIVTQLHTRELASAHRDLTTLNVVLAEEAARSLQSVDLVLSSIVNELANEDISTSSDFVRLKAGRDTHETLKAKIAGLPQLDAVTLIAADGRLINFSRGYPIPEINLSDRAYFTHLRDTRTTSPYITEPVENRGTGTWTIYLARRLSDADGRFIGLVLGAISLGYFDNLYRSLGLGGRAAVSLWRNDGTLLTRVPPLPGVGRQFKIQAFTEERLRDGFSSYDVDNSIDGVPRLVSTRALRDFPLILNVARSRDEVLSDWRTEALLVSGAAAASVCAIAMVLWALARQRYAAAAAAIAVQQREEAVSERERVEAVLRQSQKMEAVGQLTGGIAHDFNNLLAGISGSLELMQARLTQGRFQDIDRYMSAAQGAAKRAAALTHRLLAFSRRQTLDPKPINVNTLVNGMEELIRRTVGPAVEVEVVGAAGLWPALVDANQLENALLNLCINARDAMPEGGRITIETANKWLDERAARERDLPSGQYLSLCVTDTGTGMTPDVAARAFDPFFTTKPTGQGTGLGLSMIYGFVRQSGGQVRIYSEVGQGTTMCLYLPRHYGEAEGDVLLPDLAQAPRAKQGETVLVVDDEPTVRMLVTEVLADLGYTAIEAADASAGLKILQSDVRIDLLVTDVGLPGGMNGRQMADAGRVTRPSLKVLFITGYAENAVVSNGHLAPGMQVLTKPFVMEGLAFRIKNLIDST